VVLPPGSFGAGGWSPGSKFAGKYPRLTPEECVKARKAFRSLLLKRYHSVIRAWRDFDKNGDGRLSLYEFMRGCQKLGVDRGARRLWEALDVDRSGFVTLQEVDAELAGLLGTLAVCVWSACGSVEKAWKSCFNQQGKMRIGPEEFAQGCDAVRFQGDADTAFQALRADKATSGISRQEFAFLELWFVESKEPVSPLHEAVERELATRPAPELPPVQRAAQKGPSPKQQFKALLMSSYGTIVRAWREGLDTDRNGILDWKEFQRACADVGYPGSRRALWNELDVDRSGGVSLKEIDEPVAHMLEAILSCVRKRYNSWESAWHAVMDKRGDDRVERQTFIQGCGVLGYGGNADRLFELLDLDRANYLSLATTAWIEGAEAADRKPQPEVLGDIQITGQYKGVTRSQMRQLDFKARDHRLRLQRFASRDRGEVGTAGPSPSSAWASRSEGFGFQAGAAGHSSFSASAPRLEQAGFQAASPSAAKPGKAGARGQDEEQPALPDWLLSVESRPSPPSGLAMAGSSSLARKGRSRPLSPRSPGVGGWPGSRLRIVDPAWGGSPAVDQDCPELPLPVTALSRSAVSEPSLARWRAGLKI